MSSLGGPKGSDENSAACTCARLSGDPGSYPCPVHPEFGAAIFAGPVIRADDRSVRGDALREIGERIVLEHGKGNIEFETANALAAMVEEALRDAD